MTQENNLLRTDAYIDGAWVPADSGARFDVTNPADGSLVASVADVGASETARAIEAARGAQPAWAARTAKDRGAILRRWFELLLAHSEELAELMTLEMGKPISESRGEVAYGASFVDWFAEEAKRASGEIIPTPDSSKRILVMRQPVGVVAAITPWNFPVAMITRKVGPALAAGCAAVVKPAEATPLCALAVAYLAAEAGLPAGLLNVVPTSDPEPVGRELTTNPTVRKVSFTGSTAVGKRLMAQASTTMKNLSLELGGNAPFIVFDDADLDAAVEGLIASKYRNAGQTCICANRVFVQAGVHDAFAEKLVAAVGRLSVGAGSEEATDIGPLVSAAAFEKVEGLVADAVDRGARILAGGRPHELGGTFYEVSVLGDVTPEMRMAQEEIFGPVAALIKFDDEADAIRLANDTPYGLAAYFYARDVARIWRVGEALEYGLVGVNTGAISTEVAPFGGVKESGIGREGSHNGLDEYLETKYLALGGIT